MNMATAMIRSAGCVSRQIFQFTPRRLYITRNKSRIFTYHFCQDIHISRTSFHLWTLSCRHDARRYSPIVSQCIRTIHSTRTLCNDDQIVRTPPFAESVTEGDVRWAKEVGDYVEVDEVVAEIETDKTSITVSAPVAGVIEELFVPDGEKVVAGQDLCRIKASATDATAASEPKRDIPPATPPTETPPTSPPPTQAPSVSSAGPIPSSPPPEPPLPTQPSSSVSTDAVTLPPAPGTIMIPSTDTAAARTETRVKMNRMRRRIAQRLKDAQNTCAMLTTFNELDMSNVMEMRTKYKDAFLKGHGIKLGFMSAFIKASAHALKQLPAVNGAIDDMEIVYRDYVDISVAVATPKGLVVPVIRNVENMNYADIEKALNELGEKARSGNLAVEDMDGGTFTISNGGVFGSLMGTPIINPPQSAILGMHGIFDRPVAVNGKVEIRPMMYIALTYDHRLIDGREAVIFLRSIKSSVEDPRQLLLDL